MNCIYLYLPFYLSTYIPTYLPPWLILGFPFTTHGQDYKILFYDGGQSFRYKIVSIQVNLLVKMIFLENYLIKVLMQITWCCRRSTCVLLAHRIVDCVLANHNKASKASKPQNYKLITITVCVLVISRLIG